MSHSTSQADCSTQQSGRARKSIVAALIYMLILATSAQPATAAMIGTQEAITGGERLLLLDQIDRALAQASVQAQFEHLGIDSEEARLRIHALSDSELSALSDQLDTLPAGSGALGLLGAVFLVLIVLELLGVTNVFQKL